MESPFPCCGANSLVLLDVATGIERKRLGGTANVYATSVAFSPGGNLALVGWSDGTVGLWDLQSGQELRRFGVNPGGGIQVQFEPDGRSFLTMGSDNVVKIWDLQPLSEFPVISADPKSVTWLGFSNDGTRVATTGPHGATIRVWDADTGTPLTSLTGVNSYWGARFSPDGKTIATVGGEDDSAHLWDVASGKAVRTFTETLPTLIHSVDFSPDGKALLLAGSSSYSPPSAFVSVVDLATGKPRFRVQGSPDDVLGYRAVYSPDGKDVFSVGGPGSSAAELRDALTGRRVLRLAADTPSITFNSLDYSRDGRNVMACASDGYVWDAHTGVLVRKITSTLSLSGCAFSPDSESVLAVSGDGLAHLWDIATGQEIRRFAGFAAGVSMAAMSPDGRRIALGLSDGTVRFAPVDYKESVSSLCGKLLRDFTADERALYEIKGTQPTCPRR
jgi:WD40 repeat protein